MTDGPDSTWVDLVVAADASMAGRRDVELELLARVCEELPRVVELRAAVREAADVLGRMKYVNGELDYGPGPSSLRNLIAMLHGVLARPTARKP